MPETHTMDISDSLLQAFLSEERYWPAVPQSLAELGLNEALIESLVCKQLAVTGSASGRAIAEFVCIPFRLLEPVFAGLRTRHILVHSGSAPFNDYYYTLTDSGHEKTRSFQRACSYVGPAPVSLADYCISVEAQCISTESPTDIDLKNACADITCDETLFNRIGPAVNSGAGMFLYGAPGNGKSTLARRITGCFGEEIWIPRTLVEDGQLIKLFDSSAHEEASTERGGVLKGQEYDQRWVKIRRPTVCVGGELVMENLDIRHDPVS
ncbi:MAG: AAA family ATPase, partial [Planctomycetales bacterium]|nr:AAA family ATPase [Planctomycetales bacterium]